jgi:ATP-dependent Clp protease ATP-binding subunit ClpA
MKAFKIRADKFLIYAQEIALAYSSPCVDVEHLLLGLIKEENSIVGGILKKMGVDLKKIKAELEKEIKNLKTDKYEMYPISQKLSKILDYAQEFAKKFGDNVVDSEHLLLGILKENTSFASKILNSQGVNLDKIIKELQK